MTEKSHTEAAPLRQSAISDAPSLTLVWSDALLHRIHDPLERARLQQSYALLEACDALRWRELNLVAYDPALGSEEALATLHRPGYIQTVDALSSGQANLWSAHALGFSTTQTRPFPGMADQAHASVASARTAVRLLVEGKTRRAASLLGNQPQAVADCSVNGDIFNDVLFALLDARASSERVAFINVEAEHPAAIAEHFADDPTLLFLSLHEAPDYHFPGSGHANEIGRGAGRGYTANLPLLPGTGSWAVARFWEELAAPLLTRFQPEIVVVLSGTTAHHLEPLAHLSFTLRSYIDLLTRVASITPRLAVLGGDGSVPLLTAQFWVSVIAALVGRRHALPRRVPARFTETFGHEQWIEERREPEPSAALADFAQLGFDRALFEVQRALKDVWGLPLTVAEPARSVSVPLASAGPPSPPERAPAEPFKPRETPKQVKPRGTPTQRQARSQPEVPSPSPQESAPAPPEQPPSKKKRRRRRRGRRQRTRGGKSSGGQKQ